MKTVINFVTPILAFFVMLFIYTKIAGPVPFSVNSVTTSKTDTFNVSGEGKVVVIPDIAVVNVGVQTQGGTVKEVQEQLNNAVNKFSSVIKELGVDKKDIQTTNYNINPNYDFKSGSQRINGYTANTNLSIKVRQIDKANSIIDKATENGANLIGGISFDVDDKTKARNEAREKAVSEAKTTAEQAAKIAGFKLGRIINYSENFDSEPRPLRMAVGAPDESVKSETAIEPGSSEIKVIVTLSYEIR